MLQDLKQEGGWPTWLGTAELLGHKLISEKKPEDLWPDTVKPWFWLASLRTLTIEIFKKKTPKGPVLGAAMASLPSSIRTKGPDSGWLQMGTTWGYRNIVRALPPSPSQPQSRAGWLEEYSLLQFWPEADVAPQDPSQLGAHYRLEETAKLTFVIALLTTYCFYVY